MLQHDASRYPGRAVGPTPQTVSDALAPRTPRVLIVAALDKIAGLRRLLGGRDLPLRHVVRSLWWEVSLVIAASCLVIWSGDRTPGWANVSAPAFLVLIALMMRWSRLTWRELRALAAPIDAILKDPRDRARAAERLDRHLRWPLQLLVAALGAVGGLALGILTAHATGSDPHSDVSFVVLDAVTMGLGANVLWWLLVMVAWFGRLSRSESIELGTLPDLDPAIRGCRRLVRDVRIRLALGLVCAQVPLLIVSIKGTETPLPVVASVVVLVCCVGAAIAIAICPRLFLARVAKTDIEKRLAGLQQEYEQLCRGRPTDERFELRDRFELASERVRATRLVPDTSTTWLILATALAGVVPSAVSLALALMGH